MDGLATSSGDAAQGSALTVHNSLSLCQSMDSIRSLLGHLLQS